MFTSSSYIGNYSVTVRRIKPRVRPWLYKPCVTSPGETCQGGNETERDVCPPQTPLPTSLQYQLMIHMLPVTHWEGNCNAPSASPSPDPHRHPSELQRQKQQQLQGRKPRYSTVSLHHLRISEYNLMVIP